MKTVSEVQERCAEVKRLIEGGHIKPVEQHLIEDYPIGRRERGKCMLQVEANKKGFRTVKTTTNKFGRWCNPKKSTYGPLTFVVELDPNEFDFDSGWLTLSFEGVEVRHANGSGRHLAYWGYAAPRREDKPYTTVVRDLYGQVLRRDEGVLEADPPELCDAYDEWLKNVHEIKDMLAKHEVVRRLLAA